MRETKNLEFKESISSTFLKTVSAFANYEGGQILFGIADDGTVRGIKQPGQACLDIENRINDSIDPIPEYTLQVNENTSVITLTVREGLHKPYLYRAKAYRRSDSATIEVDRLELTRLILEGRNESFEELPARSESLSFAVLEDRLKRELSLSAVTRDTLRTLELCRGDGQFNIAGELLADTNSFSGTDMVRFGDSISILRDRETCAGKSILIQYDQAVAMFRKYYQYEEIRGIARETVELIPEAAFREAVANALVHRTWDVDMHIHISMFPDRIEIVSPGGLPKGMSREEYLRGGISILRNRIIGNVFYRLRMIERFGTGIPRINEAYDRSRVKPQYEIMPNSIRITLPIMTRQDLSEDENAVYAFIRNREASSSQIMQATGFRKSKTLAILKKLVSAGAVREQGNGRGKRYTAADARMR